MQPFNSSPPPPPPCQEGLYVMAARDMFRQLSRPENDGLEIWVSFFEIYGGTAPYHIDYQLEGREKGDRWVALGAPQKHEGTAAGQGFALETSAKWPVGIYRLRIKVVDAAAASVAGVESWSLVAEPAP